ncbi:hypothetical protein OAO42_01705 [Candidatus Izimaplasma bacterium]|nr:hypothetical protein [Candidatus Izimaplasma bacterium]
MSVNKVLVCKNKHCRNNNSEELLEKLKKCDIEFTHSSCMDFCDHGANIMTFPNMKMYNKVDASTIEKVLNEDADELLVPNEIMYDKDIIDGYSLNPMHKRTVKLFTYQLVKQEEFTVRSLRDFISFFKVKFDIKGMDFTYPVKIALLKTHKGPDLPKLIFYLGKERTVKILEKYIATIK